MSALITRRWSFVPAAWVPDGVLTVLCGLIVVTTTRLTPLQGDAVGSQVLSGDGSALRQLLYLAGCGVILICSRPWRYPAKLTRMPISLAVLLGWCVASISWSIAPEITVRRLGLSVMVIWIVLRIVDERGYQRTLDTVCYACLGLLVANYIAVATTSLAVHHEGDLLGDTSLTGAWRGILPHKNGTGPLCAFTLLLLMFGRGQFRLLFRLIFLAATAYFLVRTQSKTSIALTVAAAFSGWLFTRYNPYYRRLLVTAAIVLGGIAAFVINIYLPPYLLYLETSQDAFTGRIQIWRMMILYLRDHPWFGTGFGAFWNVPGGPVTIYSSSAWINEQVAEGHNGYLDLLTQIGPIGLFLGITALLIIPLLKLLTSLSVPRAPGGLQVAILIFALGHNFTESGLLATDQFMQVVIMLALACTEDMRKLRLPISSGRTAGLAARSINPRPTLNRTL